MAKVVRTKRFVQNALVTVVYQVLVMLSGFIVPRVILVHYGSEVNGLVSSITQFMAYMALVEAGLSNATIFALYKPLAENDLPGINGVVSASRVLYLRTGYLFSALVVCLAAVYPLFVRSASMTYPEMMVLIVLLGLYSALEFFTLAKYRTLLAADQRTYVISVASIVYKVLYTVAVILLAALGFNVLIVLGFAISAIFARSLVLYLYVKRRYKFVNFYATPNKRALNKKWDAFYLQILGAIQNGAPVVILTVVSGDLMVVSVYTVFNMVVMGLRNIFDVVLSSSSASFGDVIARGEQKTLQKTFSEFELLYNMLLTAVFATAYIMIMPFIRLYTAGILDTNYDYPLLGALSILNGYAYLIKMPQGQLVMSAGLFRETRLQTSIQGAICLLGGIILVYFYGVYGVLLGSIFSNIYRDIDLLFFIPRHVTHLPARSTLKRWLYFMAAFALIAFAAGFIPMTIEGYRDWSLYSALVFAFACAVVAVFTLVFDRKDLLGIIRRLNRLTGGRLHGHAV